MENKHEIVIVSEQQIIDAFSNNSAMDLATEIGWEMFKELVVKKIPIFGEAFSVADNIKNSRQMDSMMKGLKYIWFNFNILNNSLNDKIDKDFASESNAEFVSLVYRVLEQITKQYKDEKIKLLANFIANIVTKDNSSSFSKEIILEKVSYYSVEHIAVLKHIYDIDIMDGGKSEAERSILTNSNLNIKDIVINGIDQYVIKICMRDLKSDGFIDEITGSYFDYTGGNYYITDFGKICIALLSDIK